MPVPAPRGGRKVLVANLRDQPVEIHHGDAVVVVPPFDQAELPDDPARGAHLAELERQGFVSISSPGAASAGEDSARRGAPAHSRASGTRRGRARASSKSARPKPKPKPKPSEGGS
jgi:hypothetical protein